MVRMELKVNMDRFLDEMEQLKQTRKIQDILLKHRQMSLKLKV
jgi:hypothetical protein